MRKAIGSLITLSVSYQVSLFIEFVFHREIAALCKSYFEIGRYFYVKVINFELFLILILKSSVSVGRTFLGCSFPIVQKLHTYTLAENLHD